jgi:hypothetical protein
MLAILVPVNYYVLEELMDMPFTKLHYGVYTYFVLLILAAHLFMARSLQDRPQRFVVVFMASMGIKIFLSLIILVIIMYTGINNSKPFAINYLILYLVFSSFSISQILRLQRTLAEKKEKSV